jgi:hypothetical protein
MTYPQGGSEYGGYPGLVQPAPHDIEEVPYELLNLVTRTDPSDPAADANTVAETERKQGRSRLNG